MKKNKLVASILVPAAASFCIGYGIGTWRGWNCCEKYTEKQEQYMQEINGLNREFTASIEELYKDPNAQNAYLAKNAAQRNWLVSYLYSDDLSKPKREEVFKTFISNTQKCLDGLKPLKGKDDKALYLCTNNLERYKTCARLVLEEGHGSQKLMNRAWNEILVAQYRGSTNIKDVDKQEYEWREKVRGYADIEPYVDELASDLFEPNSTK